MQLFIIFLSFFADCQNAFGSCCDIWSLLVAIPRLLPLLLPLSWRTGTFLHSTHLPSILLVGYGQCHGQSHRLLLYEPQVSLRPGLSELCVV